MTTASLPQHTIADGLVLDFVKLGLDPADIDWYTADETAEISGGDGPMVQVVGYQRNDVAMLLKVADWFEVLGTRAGQVAAELRRQANSVCEDCEGHGLVGDDRECKRCSGSGTVS